MTDVVPVNESFVLGLTNEGPINPVSCTEVPGQKRTVYYRRIYLQNREDFPPVGRDDYVFNKIVNYFPVIFSIGAMVETGMFFVSLKMGFNDTF